KEFTPEFKNIGIEEVIEFKGNFAEGEKLYITNGKTSDETIYESEENIFWKGCGEAFLGTPPLYSLVVKHKNSQEDMLGRKDEVSEALSKQLTE
ncbi:MAG: hypothetical protein IJN79_09850, partial [Clostridia bacterium]|nr:hypothetical protein [Clostridia bacterium]